MKYAIKQIGVFGGSFDPPHLAHKALVQAALDELNLDEVWVLPVGIPVHKTLTSSISADCRLAWVQRMFADIAHVRVLDWEVVKKKTSPSIDSMRSISGQLDAVPVWLMGMDAWQDLPSWKGYPEHLQYCNIAVFPRVGSKMVHHDAWQYSLPSSLQQNPGHVYVCQTILPTISATAIRQAIHSSHDVSSMLDGSLKDEIQARYANANG
ncbi:MAG: nicotinate (nicotinamide) nucleotide adenylyltransferase [Mariprofundaceae bacterium]|nr:nicotinate (nicotinamide) nucleotide adenylyltransferase [Mariprofundaceae bacterium]